MPDTTSRWRQLSRQIIAKALLPLPADATESQASKAILAARPSWAVRETGASWPAEMWLLERRAAVRRRFGRKPDNGNTSVAYRLTDRSGLPWLDVACGWCDEKSPGGCLPCAARWSRVRELVADPVFRSMRAECQAAPAGIGVLLDWLEEAGITVDRESRRGAAGEGR